MKRTIVKINEELCDGCGLCIGPCAEGALVLHDGKARVIREELCDGAGFCLDICPAGALSLESREAPAFSIISVHEQQEPQPSAYIPQSCAFCTANEDARYLLQLKHRGQALWVCTQCLPRLIHG